MPVTEDTKEDLVLANINSARTYLERANTLQEVKNVIALAAAAKIFAKRINAGIQTSNYAAEIRLRAERKLGEILKATPKNPGGTPMKKNSTGSQWAPVETLAEVGISKKTSSRAQALAAVPSPEFEKSITKGRTGELIPSKIHADLTRDMKREGIKAKLNDVSNQKAKQIEGVYDVIVIDPPWPMEKIERDVRPNQSETDYPTMTETQLSVMKLPVTTDAHVWVWTTHRFLPMALRLLDGWGLKYVCTFVWHKPGGFQPIGLPQFNCEFALYARKGTPSFIDTKAFNTCFQAPRGKHSEKPEAFYDIVRRVTAGRRIDMFNRREIKDFDGWGNEANG